MKRQVGYQRRLREVMAENGMFDTTDLLPLLADRGIKLSSVQVWRLVTQTPENGSRSRSWPHSATSSPAPQTA